MKLLKYDNEVNNVDDDSEMGTEDEVDTKNELDQGDKDNETSVYYSLAVAILTFGFYFIWFLCGKFQQCLHVSRKHLKNLFICYCSDPLYLW